MQDDVREAFARYVLDTARAAVIVVARDGRVVEANRSARTLELDLLGLFERRRADVPIAPFLEDLRRSGKASTFVTSATGNVYRLDGSAAGELFVVERHDTAEHRQPDEPLDKLRFRASLGVVAATLMHDLNNLLAPILLISGRLAREVEEGSTGTMATIIHTSATLAATLTRDVLALARPHAPMVQRFPVNEALLEMRPLLERLLGEETALALELDPDAGEVLLDRKRLEHALLNLVVNARDALPSGGRGRIAISTRAVGDGGRARMLLSVSDDGLGMTDDVRARAFESFFTTKANTGGLGLGLWSVHRFAEDSHAEISIESAPGKGTAVSLLFDRLPPHDEESRPTDPVSGDVRRKGEGEVILVADPDERVRTAIQLVLEGAGYRAVFAASQESTLECAAGAPVSVAVIDDRVMRSDPRTFLHRLLALRPRLGLVVMSDAAAHVAAPATVALLSKAFTGEDLLRAVRRALTPG